MALPTATERTVNDMKPLMVTGFDSVGGSVWSMPMHDTSYDCKPHCDVKFRCEPRSEPHTDCLGNQEPTTTTMTTTATPTTPAAKAVIPGKVETAGGGQARRKKATLRLGMRWASTGNLKAVAP
ncbi:MAG: hypothetical protein Q9173_004616 [Seirophora scorigena]